MSFSDRTSIRVLSVIPPMTQINAPYPSLAYLTGFLRSHSFEAHQCDLSLALFLKLFSKEGLSAIREKISKAPPSKYTPQVKTFMEEYDHYSSTITPVIAFLQERDLTIGHRICRRDFLPESKNFEFLDSYDNESETDLLTAAYGPIGMQDRARYLASLYIKDLSDVIQNAVDSRFELTYFAEPLAHNAPDFGPLSRALASPSTLLDSYLKELSLAAIEQHQPNIVLLSVPFPGTVYGAFRIAQTIKAKFQEIVTVLGGGFANVELHKLKEPRVFDYFDYVMLGAGERPLLALFEHLKGRRPLKRLVRTFVKENAAVRYIDTTEPEVPLSEVGTPTWDGLPLDRYLSMLDELNPLIRLWSEGRWNQLTLSLGCYWKKCAFCDTTLDYISRYETTSAGILVDRIETIIEETGQRGFHFVDETSSPKVLKSLAEELIKRKTAISWWGNVRFEKSFTPELCRLLADSGCIAVTAGLETVSDRLLKLMNKGFSIRQAARTAKNFSQAGIMVHAYMIYGFPTQTVQETVDALEYVRQLFMNNCIQSGVFHRFVCTVHSAIGKDPEKFGIELEPLPQVTFAANNIGYLDPTGTDNKSLGRSLKEALLNYKHGIGLNEDIQTWFDSPVLRTTVPPRQIAEMLGD